MEPTKGKIYNFRYLNQNEEEKVTGSSVHPEPDFWLVEMGENRTPLSIIDTISNNEWHIPYPYTTGVLEPSFFQAWDPTKFQNDSTELLPQLLDQLVALGQTAQQLRHALSTTARYRKVAGDEHRKWHE